MFILILMGDTADSSTTLSYTEIYNDLLKKHSDVIMPLRALKVGNTQLLSMQVHIYENEKQAVYGYSM